MTSKKTKIAILGNSNSVMRSSYVRLLYENPEFEITNFSLGATPNAYLLYALSMIEPNRDFDFIFIETAVTDSEWSRLGLYDLAKVERNLDWSLRILKDRFAAKICVLILPTEKELVKSDFSSENIYINGATHHGVSFINFYELYRRLSRKMRLTKVAFFEDWLHLSPALHRALAAMISKFVDLPRTNIEEEIIREVGVGVGIYSVQPQNSTEFDSVSRSTSLLSNDFLVAGEGAALYYNFAYPVLLSAIAVNRQMTSCVLEIRCDEKVIYKDFRLHREAGELILHLAPLNTTLVGNHFAFRVLGDAQVPSDSEIEQTSHLNKSVNNFSLEISTAVFISGDTLEPLGTDMDDAYGNGANSILAWDGDVRIDDLILSEYEILAMIRAFYDYVGVGISSSRNRLAAQGNWVREFIETNGGEMTGPLLFEVGRLLYVAGEFNSSLGLIEAARAKFPEANGYDWLYDEVSHARDEHSAAVEADKHAWGRQ